MFGLREVGGAKRLFLVGDGELDLGPGGGVFDRDAPPPPTVRRIEGPPPPVGAGAFGGVVMVV